MTRATARDFVRFTLHQAAGHQSNQTLPDCRGGNVHRRGQLANTELSLPTKQFEQAAIRSFAVDFHNTQTQMRHGFTFEL